MRVDGVLVMGILNRTPDSFYPGSRVADDTQLLQQAEKMIGEGADILDIGGQSTRPQAELLSEEEEDAYLDEGMQAEENVFSIDYDVWKDEETGYVKIEKYSGHLHALQCPECNYQTFKVVREEITKIATPSEEGELVKHFLCGYCGYKAKKTVTLRVSQKYEESSAATA